ncbi:arginase [soil metagenome]
MKKVKIVEVRSELGAGTRGASMGPDAIRIAALDFRSPFFKQFESISVPDENALLWEPEETPHAKRIRGISVMYERMAETVKETLLEGLFPIILTGDHSSAGGLIAGVRKAYPKKKLGVIWIDAHADMHTPYTSPSGNVHGMPLAALLGFDNREQQVNTPTPSAIEHWEKMKNTSGVLPSIKPEHLVFIGIRDTEPQENSLIAKHKIKKITVKDLKKHGVEKVTLQVFKHLRSCDYIYISLDMDSIDPKVSKGTGTPVPNGISERDLKQLVLNLVENDRVCAFEVTEVNPTLDKENRMAETAFEILQIVVNELTAE